jgi:hypothetical protein
MIPISLEKIKRGKFKSYFKKTSFMMMFLAVISCGVFVGNPTDDDGEGQEAFVSGSFIHGPVNSATIKLFQIEEDGSRGEELGETTTDENGDWSITITSSGAVEAVATFGDYTDEATGTEVSLDGNTEITSLVNTLPGSHFAINALTHIAAKKAKNNAASGLETSIIDSKTSVAELFGISGVDFTNTRPLDLTSAESTDTSGNDATIGLLLAAFSQALEDNTIEADQLEILTDSVAEDYQDGGFDLKANGSDLDSEKITQLAPYDFMVNLGTYITNFLGSAENNSSMTESPISSFPTPPQTPAGTSLRGDYE